MKRKEKLTRSIAIILVLSMIISLIPITPVHAESDVLDDNIIPFESVFDDDEEIEEAKDDATCPYSTNDWNTAIHKDYLPWNFFHNIVQNEIVKKYKLIGMDKELTIKYKYTKEDEKSGLGIEGKATGKHGRADLYYKKLVDNVLTTYIWEVKPISYVRDPRKTKGENQLKGYVSSEPNYYIGDSTIENGEIIKKLTYQRAGNIIEHVTYKIKYYNEGNGLILYSFTRTSKKEKKDDDDNNNQNSNNEGKDQIDDTNKTPVDDYIEDLYIVVPVGPETKEDEEPAEEEETTEEPETTEETETTESAAMDSPEDTVEPVPGVPIPGTPIPGTPIPGTPVVDEELVVTGAAAYVLFSIAVIWMNEFNSKKYNQDSVSKTKAAIASAFIISYLKIGFPVDTVHAAELSQEDISEFNENANLMLGLLYALYGEDFENSILGLAEEANEDRINEIIDEMQNLDEDYERAGKATPPRDPLIIDLGHDGIELTTLEDGVNFDLDNNTFEEKTAWIGIEDGFLALDKNNNGKIDNGGELFGDKFVMPNGKVSSTGFEALSSLDDNLDNEITKGDKEYVNLRVWTDANHNGKTDDNELISLEDLSIQKINLDYTVENNVDTDTGTMQAEYSAVTFLDGTQKRIGEFWFPVNSSDTTQDGNKTAGNVPNISQAINKDESGVLQELCLEFNNSKDISIKRKYLKQVMYFITGADDIDPESRGGNIDARDLKVIEEFMGREFVGVSGSNPNAPAAEILKQIYNDIENYYYNILNLETSFGGIISIVSAYEDEDGKKQIDINVVDYIINEKMETHEEICTFIYDFATYLRAYDKINGTDEFKEFSEKYAHLSDEYAEVLDLAKSANTYLGTSYNDSFVGTSFNDFVFGSEGDDNLSAEMGKDYIYGGLGNDILNGGYDDDSYYFELNHGNDLIIDETGNSTFIFKDNLSYEEYEIAFNDNLEMLLTNSLTGDTITLKNFINNPAEYDFYFNDETIIIGGGSKRNVINGTSDNDQMSSGEGLNIFRTKSGNDLIHGGENMDIIYGDAGDDELYGANGINLIFGGVGNDTIYDGDNTGYIRGEDGNDNIYAGGGDDSLDGGIGDDYLEGNHGNDKYIYKKGYNVDTIVDTSGDNTVRISGYTDNDMINTRNTQNDLIIEFKDSKDRLIINKYFDNNVSRQFKFVFDNGVILEHDSIVASYPSVEGTEGDDWLTISDVNGGIAYGKAGNDGINGASGNDQLYGNEGNDTLYGNDGDDMLDGGTGNDNLDGGNGNDIYTFALSYGCDTINDWNGDSIVKFIDISSKDITITEQNNSNLVINFNESAETLIINGYKWNQGLWTFEFADGAIATVNKMTFELEYIKEPDITENTDDINSSDEESVEPTDELQENEDESEIVEDIHGDNSNEATTESQDENTDNEETELSDEVEDATEESIASE